MPHLNAHAASRRASLDIPETATWRIQAIHHVFERSSGGPKSPCCGCVSHNTIPFALLSQVRQCSVRFPLPQVESMPFCLSPHVPLSRNATLDPAPANVQGYGNVSERVIRQVEQRKDYFLYPFFHSTCVVAARYSPKGLFCALPLALPPPNLSSKFLPDYAGLLMRAAA